MRPIGVVVEAPLFDLPPSVIETCEPVEIEAVVAELPIEGLDEAVFDGLAWTNECELDVLELLGRRLTNKEIAARLGISPATVKMRTLGIYRKLGVHGRRQAVAAAIEQGILRGLIAEPRWVHWSEAPNFSPHRNTAVLVVAAVPSF